MAQTPFGNERRFPDAPWFQSTVLRISDMVDGNYQVIDNNLQYATGAEVVWARTANEASIRAAARQKPEDLSPQRITPNRRVPVNPFWYHHPITD